MLTKADNDYLEKKFVMKKEFYTSMDAIGERFDSLESRFDNLESRFGNLEQQVKQTNAILTKMIGKMDKSFERQDKLIEESARQSMINGKQNHRLDRIEDHLSLPALAI